jgi:hypothetical protein
LRTPRKDLHLLHKHFNPDRELPFHAHVKGKTVRAYARGDLFDKRRALMQAWSDFSATGASVTPIRDGRHHDGVR